jgi:hypothetical protein
MDTDRLISFHRIDVVIGTDKPPHESKSPPPNTNPVIYLYYYKSVDSIFYIDTTHLLKVQKNYLIKEEK